MLCQLEGEGEEKRELYLEGFEDSGAFKSLIWGMGRGFAPIAISSQHDSLLGQTQTWVIVK